MNFRQYLLAVITGLFVLCNFSCAKISSSAHSEVVFDDGYKMQPRKSEVTIDDSSFSQISQLSTKIEAHEETPVQLKDGSILTVTYDAFGNKTETRGFPGDSRLLMLSVTTSADGKQEIMVRGRNLERKSLPPALLDRVLTMNAGEIAQTAGIFETMRETYLPNIIATQQVEPKQTYQAIQPTPIPQNSEKIAKEENTASSAEQKPVEQKPEKIEENSQLQQNSLQKDLVEPVAVPKRKDTSNQ